VKSPRDVNPFYSAVLYRVGQWVCAGVFKLLWRFELHGVDHLPKRAKGVILAVNHRSYIDPPLVGCRLDYPLFFFAKQELFSIPLLGWYIRRVNSFPVSRSDHDVGAFKTALRVLRAEQPLVLFPEGGRRLDPRRQFKAKPGVGMLAGKAQVPVIPVGIFGADRLGQFPKVIVRYGKPIPPPSPEDTDYQRYSDRIMERIKELCHA